MTLPLDEFVVESLIQTQLLRFDLRRLIPLRVKITSWRLERVGPGLVMSGIPPLFFALTECDRGVEQIFLII